MCRSWGDLRVGENTMKNAITITSALCAAVLLSACGTTEYIMGTTEGRLIVTAGKPSLDDKAGLYTYRDANGKESTIPKSAVGQIMER
jgi:major membrane immunogen (membrane-anchored lipoprotein)